MDPLPAVYRRTLRSVDRGNTRKAGAVLVNSRYSAGVARCTYGVTAVVTFHGVDVERFRPLSVAKGNTVLSVGSLTPLKGFDFLVRAIGLLPPASRPVLVLASNFENPPERVHLQNLAREEGVDVEVRGQVDDCDLVRLYNAARMVAYAPVREPFGLVPLEAMACATPVVAVAEGGVPETIVDGVTGFLVDRDPSQFAGAAKRLMDQPHVGRRLGENGREHVLASWTWDRAVQSLAARLEAAASARTVADA